MATTKTRSLKNFGLLMVIGLVWATSLTAACGRSTPLESTKGGQPESKPSAAEGSKPAASAKPADSPTPGAVKPQAKVEKIRLASATTTVSMATPKLAGSMGYFKDEGLEVEDITLQGGAATSAALISGDIDAVAGGANEVVDLINQGQKGGIAVYCTANGNTMSVAVNNSWIEKKGIDLNAPAAERIAKLKGAAFGAPSLGGTTEMYIWLILKEAGVKKGDADIVKTGGGAAQVAALESGQIDAFAATPPSPIEAELRGKARVVVTPKDLPGLNNYPKEVVYFRRSFVQEHPEAVRRMVRAMEKARQMITQNPTEAAKQLTVKFPGMSGEALLKSILSLQETVVRGGKMTEEQWQKMGAVMKDVGELKQNLPSKTEGLIWTNEYFQ